MNTEIIVNGRKRIVETNKIKYEDLPALAFVAGTVFKTKVVCFTVTFKDGNKSGTMSLGDSVKAKPGMIFNVSATNKS